MSCPEITYSPGGRQGIGVAQPQSGLDYPLVQQSAEIRYLLADFYFAYSHPETVSYPLKIKRLYNIGCIDGAVPTDHVPRGGDAADIILEDDQGQIVFDTTTAELVNETRQPWSDDYKIYTWTTTTASCRMLVHTTWAESDTDATNYAKYLAPINAELDARSVYQIPKHIRSLYVQNGNIQSGPYRNAVIFKNGYNTELVAGTAAVVGIRRTTRLNFSALPGSGDGQYPCAETATADSFPIKNINGIQPREAGHFLLGAADCLWLRRPTVYSDIDPAPIPQTASQQQMGADCKPCCSCTDYAATALYMNATGSRYQYIGAQATDIKELHESNIARWNVYRRCTISNPLKLTIFPQRAPFIDVAVMLCNSCTDCFPAAALHLELAVTNGRAADGTAIADDVADADVVCGHTEAYFPGVTARTAAVNKLARLTYETFFPQLKAGNSGYIKFRLQLLTHGQFNVTATLTGTFAGNNPIPLDCGTEAVVGEGPVPAVAVATSSINFNLTGKASRSC